MMSFHPTVQFLIAFVIVGMPAWSSLNAAIVLNGLESDAHAVDSNPRDGIGDLAAGTTNVSLRVGLAGSTGTTNSQSVVFVFQLPDLGTTESIASASFTFTFLSYQTASSVSSLGNVDLYGLGYSTSSSVVATHYFHGPLDSSSSATLLQDNILTPTGFTANSAVSTTEGASATIADYLNAQYAAGAVAGDYVFFRLSADAVTLPVGATINARGYNVASADHTTVSYRPTLSLTVVPEPSREFSILLACSFVIFRRRRKPPPSYGSC